MKNYLIHDELIVATRDHAEHNKVIEEVMKVISTAGITLNPNKCTFGASEIEFWGLRIGSTGIRACPAKVEALNYISPPKSKKDLVSFPCLMQSNADFIIGSPVIAVTSYNIMYINILRLAAL